MRASAICRLCCSAVSLAVEKLLEQRPVGLRLALQLVQLHIGGVELARLLLQLGQPRLERGLMPEGDLVLVADGNEDARDLRLDLLANIAALSPDGDEPGKLASVQGAVLGFEA